MVYKGNFNKRKKGIYAEDYAVCLLKNKGYKIIDRNFNTPFSEIDIIAEKNNLLVFVEVKARWGTKFGRPEEFVNEKKIFRIKKAGELYFLKNPELPKKSMILVVSLIYENKTLVSEKLIKVY